VYGHSSQLEVELTVGQMESLLGRSSEVDLGQMEVITWSL